ncbi:C-type lectin domain family 4 member E-like isoform X1 [Gambusia affinis]|uniref:C-type lectin domain family 4 member E-like isoform X1 n=1 Tax=Gambusia affinis TaxID=33528 RepID=UPI001CDD88CC|nr:C-type lectin domain family 4 member E-like isoform X1 [Gambusia affinis]
MIYKCRFELHKIQIVESNPGLSYIKMSSDIYSKVQLSKKVRYTRNEQENRTDWEEKEVNIYESAENVADYYSVSQPQEEGQQTQRQPAVRKSSSRVKLCKILPWVIMSVAIITLTIYFTLEMKNTHSDLSEMAANYSQLHKSYEILSKNHNQLTDQVKRLNDTITGKSCPDGWTRFGCSCYFKGKEKKTWDDSRKYCEERGAHLVIINSHAEQEFIKQFNKDGESWIGLQRKWINGQWTYDWKWVDESPLKQSFWGTGWPIYYKYQPYAVCCNFEGKWITVDYNYYRNWICEK